MRLWSLHPVYLDAKGIVALWRETLLAKRVLEGKTKGYKNHPQLNRFKKVKNPLHAINQYLAEVFYEAEKRNYHFDQTKIDWGFKKYRINVTKGQIDYELKHLLKKLQVRDREKYLKIRNIQDAACFSIFKIVEGMVEDWEVL